MKNFIRITSYVILAGFFSIALSGCGKNESVDPDANKIVVWGFEDEDAWKPIISDFKSKYNDLTVEYYKHELNDNYENDLLNSVLSGQGPDVWEMPNDWLQRHQNKIIPMPEKMAEKFDLDLYISMVKDNIMIDNSIYALAPSADPLVLYYNPTIIRETKEALTEGVDDLDYINKISTQLSEDPPKMWSELIETAKLLTKKNGDSIERSGLAMGTANISSAVDILYLLMLQNNTNIISYGEKVATFNLPANTSTGSRDLPGKRALDFYTSFADTTSQNYTWNDSLGNDIEAFAQGKVAMMFGFSSMQNILLQKYPNIDFETTYAPQIQGDAGKMADYAKFNVFVVSKLARNPGAAWLLNSAITTDYSDGLNSYTRLYTSVKSSDANNNYTLAERTGPNPEMLSLLIAKTIPKGRYPVEFDSNIREAIALSSTRKQDSQSALDLAASNCTNLLRKEQW